MKKILFLFMFTFVVVSCSQEENINKESKRERVVDLISPDGFMIAKSVEDLGSIVFLDTNEKGSEIISIEYVSLNKEDGAIAFINYKTKNGEYKNLAYVKGNVKTNYKNDSVKFVKLNSSNNSSYREVIYKCSGQGCCYVGGTYNYETGEETFFCKCEGNPNQNSSCTLSVTVLTKAPN